MRNPLSTQIVLYGYPGREHSMSSVAKKVAIRFAAEQDQWQERLSKKLDELRRNPVWLVRDGLRTAVFSVNTASLGNAEDLARVYGHKGGADFAMAWVEAPVFGSYLTDAGAKLRESSIHFADLVQAHGGGPRPMRIEMVAPVPLDAAIGVVIRVSGSWEAAEGSEALQKLGDDIITSALKTPELQAALARWEGRSLSTKAAGMVTVSVPKGPLDLPIREISAGVASFATHAR